MPAVVINTERLVLRELKSSDFADIQEYATDPEVCKYTLWGPNTEKQTKDFLRAAIEDAKDSPRINYTLAVSPKDKNKVIGGISLMLFPTDPKQAEIGYVLKREHWCKGYITEAARALIEFGFKRLKLHRIIATCDPLNTGSERVMEKSRMRREALFRQDKFIKGHWRDRILYAILEDEWT